jgi:hypothetical protein
MIVGISGLARSGKDTLGKLFVDRGMFRRRSFAGNLKQAAQDIFGFDAAQLHGDKKEVIDPYWGFTPRWALQFLGTDLCRKQLDTDIWVRSTMRGIDKNSPISESWCLTDVRFRNEALAIHRRGGIVVRIERDAAGASNGIIGHASEDLSDVPYDVLVPNNGEIRELVPWVTAVFDELLTRRDMYVEAAAAHVMAGRTLETFEFQHIVPSVRFGAAAPTLLPESYTKELDAGRLRFSQFKDDEFVQRVEREIETLSATS